MTTYNFDLTINGKNISCRAFTLEEYLNLIKAKADKVLDKTIKQLIKDCTNAKGLNKQESELLLVNLWAHSLGEVNHTATWVCECGNEIDVPINTNRIQIVGSSDLLYSLGELRIQFKYPELFDDNDIALMIAKSIDYIIVNGEQIFVDDLSDQEIDDLYSAITTEDVLKIKDMLLKPQIQLAVPISCKCGKNHVHQITGLKEFFKVIQ